ncbi:MAG: FeoC-like transcriptional regulator [Halothece sp.]
MILSELQSYLSQRDRASLEELTIQFDTDAQALRPMLTRLIRKGRVRQLPMAKKCSGCCSCSPEQLEFYEWLGK